MKRPLYVGVPAPGEDPNEYNKRALASIEQWSHETDEVTENFDLNGHYLIIDDGFGFIDENGNEQLIFQTTALAVNYWEMTNAAANGVLRLEAKGDDTHVAITLASKGTDPINLEVNGSTEATLDATNFKPGANDGNALGASGTAWADLFLASGGVIDFAGDVTITHSTNLLAFAGATSGYSFDDDILLPSSGVLNWNSGNATITHSTGLLTSNVDIVVPDEAYDATNWNGSLEVPTKNAVRDKFESLSASALILIETLAAGTGTTATSGTIAVTYKKIEVAYAGISHDSGSSQSFLVEISDDGTNWGTANIFHQSVPAATLATGSIHIHNTGVAATTKVISTTGSSVGTLESSENGITVRLRFSPSGGNFDAGTFYIYGVL